MAEQKKERTVSEIFSELESVESKRKALLAELSALQQQISERLDGKASEPKRTVKCSYCTGTGHTARNCPKKKEDERTHS